MDSDPIFFPTSFITLFAFENGKHEGYKTTIVAPNCVFLYKSALQR